MTESPEHEHETAVASPPPPPPAGGEPSRGASPRITKDPSDEVIDGVASGIACHLGVDPLLVRLGFVALVFAGGFGLIAYLACVVAVPDPETADRAATRSASATRARDRRGPEFWVGIGLLAFGVLLLANRFGMLEPGFVWPLALIAAGVLLFQRRASSDPEHRTPEVHRPAPDTEPPATPPSPSPWEHTMPTAAPTTPSPTSSPPTPPGSPATASHGGWRPPERPTPGSPLGKITLAVALIAVGVTILGQRADLVDAALVVVPSVALAVLGLGLVVGAFVGRARWLIMAGGLLVPVVVLAALGDDIDGLSWAGGAGDREVVIDEPDQVAEEYALGAGEYAFDLTELDTGGRTVRIDTAVGAGQITVLVPDDITVTVDASALVGQVELFDTTTEGIAPTREIVDEVESSEGSIELELGVLAGQITVERRP